MQYSPLNQEECESYEEKKTRLPAKRASVWLALAKFFFCGVCLMLSFFFGSLSSAFRAQSHSDGIEIPWAEDLVGVLSKEPIRFSGAFNFTNKYRGPPSPEIDAAWNRYDFNPMLRVSAEEINTAVRGQEGYIDTAIEIEGGGYLATIEVFHQFHCLNMIRMATHHEYYKDKGMYGNQTQDVWRTHIDHCIEIMRQIITCNSDTGLIAFHWVEGNPNPYPDLSTWHQCRDVEVVHDWAMKKQSNNDIDPVKGVVKNSGVKQLKADP